MRNQGETMHEEQQMEQFPTNAHPPENADNAEAEPLSPFHNFLATIIIVMQQISGAVLRKISGISFSKDFGESIIMSGIGTLFVAGALTVLFLRKKIRLQYVWGTWRDFGKNWTHLLIVIPLMMLTLGYTGICFGLLGKIAPEFVKDLIAGFSVGSGYSESMKIVIAIMGSFLVPLGEEILFRGAILYRLASYKTLRQAVMASSILFACLHPHNFLGTFAFAYCAAISYIYTRSLLIPIGIHILNNSLSLNMVGGYSPFKSPIWTKDVPDIVDVQNVPINDFIWLTIFFIIGAFVIWRYIKAHPITADTKLPYFAALEESEPPSQSSIATA